MNKSYKLAIIESDSRLTTALKQILNDEPDFEIVGTAANGNRGISLIERTHPDLVLLELLLFGADGYSVMNTIREENSDCRFIVLSSIDNKNLIEAAADCGASYYLVKPIQPEILKLRIRDALNGKFENFKTNTKPPLQQEETNKENKQSLPEAISSILIALGVPPQNEGYRFFRQAILFAIENPNILNRMTKELYPSIAETFESTPERVERAMRHSLEVAWKSDKLKNINKIFGLDVYVNTKFTNGELIALIADKLRNDTAKHNN